MRKIAILLILLLMASAVGAVTLPYRYETGFKLWGYDIDLWGRNITNGTITAKFNITNVTSNYTANKYDDSLFVYAFANAVNISLPDPAENRGKQYIIKKTDSSNKNVTVQAAALFIGNESNNSNVWDDIDAADGNQTYFYSFNHTGLNFTLTSISVHSNGTGEQGYGNISIYNNTNVSDNKPYYFLGASANVTFSDVGIDGLWVQHPFTTGITIEHGIRYWIAVKFKSNPNIYVTNISGVTNYTTVYNMTIGILPNRANAKTPGKANGLNRTGYQNNFVPNFALNLLKIDGGNVTGTNQQFGLIRLQSDGDRYWKV